MVKGTLLAKPVKATINSQPQLITKLIIILQNIEVFNSLAYIECHIIFIDTCMCTIW